MNANNRLFMSILGIISMCIFSGSVSAEFPEKNTRGSASVTLLDITESEAFEANDGIILASKGGRGGGRGGRSGGSGMRGGRGGGRGGRSGGSGMRGGRGGGRGGRSGGSGMRGGRGGGRGGRSGGSGMRGGRGGSRGGRSGGSGMRSGGRGGRSGGSGMRGGRGGSRGGRSGGSGMRGGRGGSRSGRGGRSAIRGGRSPRTGVAPRSHRRLDSRRHRKQGHSVPHHDRDFRRRHGFGHGSRYGLSFYFGYPYYGYYYPYPYYDYYYEPDRRYYYYYYYSNPGYGNDYGYEEEQQYSQDEGEQVDTFADVREKLAKQRAEEEPRVRDRLESIAAVFRLGDYEEAMKLANRAVQNYPYHPILEFVYSQALFANGRYDKSADVLREALRKVDVRSQKVIFGLEFYPDSLALHDKIEQLKKVSQADPYDGDLQLLLGYHLAVMGRYDQSKAALVKAKGDYVNKPAAAMLERVLASTEDTGEVVITEP